jgi:hypothetical protein
MRKNIKGIMINFISTGKKGHILGVILLAIAGISAGCTTKAETTQKSEPPAAQKETATAARTPVYRTSQDPYSERQFDDDLEYSVPAPQKSPAVKLTRAAFAKIKVGMTLAEVEKMLGEEGMLVSTMDVNGRKTQIYKWSSDNFSSYVDVTVENGKVVEMKEKGLK